MDELTRLASDVSQLTRRVDDLSYRVAVMETQGKHIDEKLGQLNEGMRELKTSISRVGWIILTAFLGIFVKFVLDGGLVI